jgi:central kinetochore subunit Mal2/MCM21
MATIEALDNEIISIRARIATLQSHRANLTSILLSQPHLSTHIAQGPVNSEAQRATASSFLKAQQQRNTENIHRACAGVTAYKVRDPDPCAVDNGNILGVRIEVAIRGRFIETYHVLFNRPNERHKLMLKIHKHTVPSCIPLQALRNKLLPSTERYKGELVEQKLVQFGRALRRELVAWHLRMEVMERLRVDAGLGDKASTEVKESREPATGKVLNAFVSDDEDEEEEEEEEEASRRRQDRPMKIMEIEADIGVREISVIWLSGQTGVFSITKDGNVEKAVVTTAAGVRVSELSRKALGRIEGIVQRLAV